MTDREKLVEILLEVGKNIMSFPNEGFNEHLADFLIAHGVTVKQMQKPIKRGHLLENSPCWFEAIYDDGYFELEPAEITKGTGANYYIYIIGSETATRLDGKEYGEWWRCWAEKPTDEERKAAEWE
jgi:hypothetical protein